MSVPPIHFKSSLDYAPPKKLVVFIQIGCYNALLSWVDENAIVLAAMVGLLLVFSVSKKLSRFQCKRWNIFCVFILLKTQDISRRP